MMLVEKYTDIAIVPAGYQINQINSSYLRSCKHTWVDD